MNRTYGILGRIGPILEGMGTGSAFEFTPGSWFLLRFIRN